MIFQLCDSHYVLFTYFNFLFHQVGFDKDGLSYPVCVITGAPGVGKSCFVWNLAAKWKENELFKNYRLAILIRLRDSYVSQATAIEHLVQHEMQEVRNGVSTWINLNNGKECLLILDGFDEFPAELQRESFIKEIICREKLGGFSLIITTRSNAAKDLYCLCNRQKHQYLEVLGFSQDQIDDYIRSSFEDDISISNFQCYLKCCPNIRSCMFIPLLCAIVIQIHKSKYSKKVAKTMTELYNDAIKILIVRSIRSDKRNPYFDTVESLQDLPDKIQNCFGDLCGIANESTIKDEVVFERKISEQTQQLGK